ERSEKAPRPRLAAYEERLKYYLAVLHDVVRVVGEGWQGQPYKSWLVDERGQVVAPQHERSPGGRPSAAAPHRDFIVAGIQRGLSAKRIWRDLVEQRGYAHGYETVQRYVRRIGPGRPEGPAAHRDFIVAGIQRGL